MTTNKPEAEGEGVILLNIREMARRGDSRIGKPLPRTLIARLQRGDSVGLWDAIVDDAFDVVIESQNGDMFMGRLPKLNLGEQGELIADEQGQLVAFHACNIFMIWNCGGVKCDFCDTCGDTFYETSTHQCAQQQMENQTDD